MQTANDIVFDGGVFHKGEHKKCFAYEAHTICEKRGYMMEVEVTPGNVHDSVAFDAVFDRLVEHYPAVEVVIADAGDKTPWNKWMRPLFSALLHVIEATSRQCEVASLTN